MSRPSNKLNWRQIGPYPVVRAFGSHAYEVKLLESIKVHPVFHVWLLEPDHNNPLPGQIKPPPEPVEVDGEMEWFVDEVLDARIFGRWKKLKYLIKWQGYPDATWEPAEEVDGLEAIELFHKNYPDKPGPLLISSAS